MKNFYSTIPADSKSFPDKFRVHDKNLSGLPKLRSICNAASKPELRSICNAASKLKNTSDHQKQHPDLKGFPDKCGIRDKNLSGLPKLRSICNAASNNFEQYPDLPGFGNLAGLRILLIFALFALPYFAKAQERITIDDPALSFSYLLPEGYAYTDDPYFHYIYPESGSKEQLPRLTLTYFDGYCPDLDKCFDGKLNGDLRTEYSDFNSVSQKSTVVSNTAARLATYHFTHDGKELEGMLCVFIKFDAFFVIEAQFVAADSAKYTPVFDRVIESIEVFKR